MTHVDTQMISDNRRAVRLAERPDPIKAAGLDWYDHPLSYYQGTINGSLIRFQWQAGVALIRKMVNGRWKPVDAHIEWAMSDDEKTKRLEAAR